MSAHTTNIVQDVSVTIKYFLVMLSFLYI